MKEGEIRRGKEIGYAHGRAQYIWHACVDCGKERWVGIHRGNPVSTRCLVCSSRLNGQRCRGERSGNWKGGRVRTTQGYILIRLQPDDFFFPMAQRNNGYVFEHRLVMAKSLKRNLHPWEIVHHKNHKRQDNRIGNLQLIQEMQHTQLTLLEGRIERLESRVLILESENIILRRQCECPQKSVIGDKYEQKGNSTESLR